jgi:uroporphyrin-3 C-methyltransferase
MNNRSDEPEDQDTDTDGAAGDTNLSDAGFADLDDGIRVEEPKPPRSPIRLAMLALALSLVSIAGVAYLTLMPDATPEPLAPDTTALDALTRSVNAGDESVRRLQQHLNELINRHEVIANNMEAFQQQLDQRLERQMEIFESLPGRMSNVENSMSSIQGISTGVRDSWLLAEAEYYMQIANAQLQLAGNPSLAGLALLQADDRIRQLANPALTNIRRALSNELRALELINRPDIEGVTLTLASLAEVVQSLPLRQQIDIPDEDDPEIESELSGFDRAIASLKSTVGDVVSVRRTDEAVRPLIAPESAFFLRANLSLQLQVARLALLRGERAAFQQSLDDTNTWLGEYYDADSAQVQSARKTIAEIRDGLFDIAMPDISESLRLLRQHNTLSAAPVEQTVPPEAEAAQ